MRYSIKEREKAERAHWRENEEERPGADSIANLLFKMTDGYVFYHVVEGYKNFFKPGLSVLELGGGQGWGACILKKMCPGIRITLTDISESALVSRHRWERIFGVSIDAAYACTSYAIAHKSSSLDIVFCFAAAHHFADLALTMKEVARVLRPGGHCFFFHEPATSRLLHGLAHSRVNKKRPAIPEDVIVHAQLLSMARRAGLEARADFNPLLFRRYPLEMFYYYVLSKLKVLQRILPCSVNFHFAKP